MAQQSTSCKKGEQIRHFSHPQHALTLAPLPYLFTCHGCKEHGAGPRYRCSKCNIDIHEFCAKAPPSFSHPYHTQHPLIFYIKPAAGLVNSKCEVCSHSFKGFAYGCNVCNFNIHSCCAQLPKEVNFYGHPQHALKLLTASLCAKGSSYTCGACGRKGCSWVYYCDKCGYYLDTVCAKTTINGRLHPQRIVVPPKQSKFKTAARCAAQAGQLFVGGLVESIGEAVAGIILDNVTKDCNSHGGQGIRTDQRNDGY